MRARVAFLEPVTATSAIDRLLAARIAPSRHLQVWGASLALVVVALIGVARLGSGGSVRPVAPAALSARHGLASLPLAAQAPVAAALGRSDRAYWVTGSSARNPAQALRLGFSARGVRVASGRGAVTLSLSDYGRIGAIRRLGAVAPVVQGNRVVYARPGVREWYENGPLGLEQGFDVSQRPVAGSGRVVFSVSLAGDLQARMSGGGVIFGGHGASLRYTGLTATDALGRQLPASIQVRGRRLIISVDDRGARYPLRVDPFVQQAELTASDATGQALAYSVAVSGTTVVAGAPAHAVGANTSQGAVYVFAEPAAGWANATQTAELTASDGAMGDGLGYDVAISGNTIVAGAPQHAVAGHAGQGAAYVFVEPASGWKNTTQTAELTASDGAATDAAGYFPVAISGNTIVFGARFHMVGTNAQQGAAYVFVKPASGWVNATQTAELTASNGVANDVLGLEVAVSGNTVAVVGNAGLYVFVEPATGWANGTQTAELMSTSGPIQPDGSDQLSISGNTIALGSVFQAVGANSDQGAVYVFVEPATGWANGTQTAELTASDGAAGDDLGFSVSISGTTIVAGAPSHTVGTNLGEGAAYVFTQPAGGWVDGTQTAELTSSSGAMADELGYSASVDAGTIVAGARNHNLGAFVFVTPGSTPPGGVPVNTTPPKVTGTPLPGDTLTCNPGAWTNSPTSFTYQWNRDGKPIPGATSPRYTVQIADSAHTLTCTVTAANASGHGTPARSSAVVVAVKGTLRCPKPSGRLDGSTLGPLALGDTKAQERKKLPKFNVIGYGFDNFCLYGGFGIRVGYPSTKLLHTLTSAEQKRIKGTIAIALTANPFYKLDGITPGTRLTKTVTRKLKLGKTFHIGLNYWYIAPGKKANGVLKVRKNIIDEVGIVDKPLTANRKSQQRLLSSFRAD